MSLSFFKLKGKTALITGASSGLGWRFAEILCQAGAKVIIAARRIDKLQNLEKELKHKGGLVTVLQLDVEDKQAVNAIIDKLSAQDERIDILVNNAGTAKSTSLFENDKSEAFESMLRTNVLGAWHTTQATARHMKDFNIDGSIINISSISGDKYPEVNWAGYCASKAAVIQMMNSLVQELGKHNIRINCILPGWFRTPMTEDDDFDNIAKKIPLGFVPTPEDLDGTILYLASNHTSRYLTGSCITVDGGISCVSA